MLANVIEEVEVTSSYQRSRQRSNQMMGLGNFGGPIRDEVADILRSMVVGLPGAADTTNPSYYNALTYAIGPNWPSKAGTPTLLTELKAAKTANKPYMLRYFGPQQVMTLQARLSKPADGKLGSGTAAAIAEHVPNWHRMSFDSLLAALPLKATPGPSAETVVMTSGKTPTVIAAKDGGVTGKLKNIFGRHTTTIALVAGAGILAFAFLGNKRSA